MPASGRSATVAEIASRTLRSEGEAGTRMWYSISRLARAGSSKNRERQVRGGLCGGNRIEGQTGMRRERSCVRG